MKSYPAWVVWQHEQRDGKPTKVPYSATDPEQRASATDLRTWAAFREAVEAYETRGFDGIGFVVCSGDPFSAVNLDGCRDAETGELDEWAARVVRR